MNVDGIEFSEEAIEHLRRHGKIPGTVREACERQVARARRQLARLDGLYGPESTVVDVGCGLAIVDALMECGRTHLIDGNAHREAHGEYRDRSEPWFDVRTAVRLVRSRRPRRRVLTGWTTGPADLIISLKSWGLHYPANTYLDRALRCLRPGGHLVLDLHRTDAADEVAAAGFELVGTGGSYDRPGRALLPFVHHIFRRI